MSVAATTFDKPEEQSMNTNKSEMTMSEMTASLKDKKSDDYDKEFVAGMIDHHQAAVDMAKLSAKNAKHNEVKQLSQAIIAAQEKEISEMKQWQMDWGYSSMMMDNSSIGH